MSEPSGRVGRPARPGFRSLALGLAIFCGAFAALCGVMGDAAVTRFAGLVVNGWLAYVFLSIWRTGDMPGRAPKRP